MKGSGLQSSISKLFDSRDSHLSSQALPLQLWLCRPPSPVGAAAVSPAASAGGWRS